MALPAKYDMRCRIGSSFLIPMSFQNLDGSNIALNDGSTFRMQVRPTPDSRIILLDFNTSNGGIVLQSDNQTLVLSHSKVVTSSLTPTDPSAPACYDLLRDYPDGITTDCLVEGNFTIYIGVTR